MQIKQEVFLEDVVSLISTGTVPGLFPQDEKNSIYDIMRNIDRQREKSRQVRSIGLYGTGLVHWFVQVRLYCCRLFITVFHTWYNDIQTSTQNFDGVRWWCPVLRGSIVR